MLKPGDPAFDKLLENLRSVASSRYVEELLWGEDDSTVLTKSDAGVTFEQLEASAQTWVLESSIPWGHYKDQGLSDTQAALIVSNVRNGKPPERWLEGIFEEAALENQRIASFKAMVEDSKNSPGNRFFEEMDGDRNPWVDLSAAAKLQYIALDAVRHDVPFESFAEVVRETIGEVGEAALRVVLDGQKELSAIAELFPDDGRTEPTPLVELVKEMMDYASALEMQEWERRQGREKLFEGISSVLDGKPPRGWSECAKAFQDILRGDYPKQQEVKTQERGGREI